MKRDELPGFHSTIQSHNSYTDSSAITDVAGFQGQNSVWAFLLTGAKLWGVEA